MTEHQTERTEATGRKRAEAKSDAVRQRRDGRWFARPTLGTDPATGAQVRVSGVFDTKREALAWIKDQRQKFDSGAWATRSAQTLDEVVEHWLSVRQADEDIRANTVRADIDSLAYSRRVFGSTPIQRITRPQLVTWSLAMTRKDGGPLHPDTKRRAIVTLRQVFAHAATMGWIGTDPTTAIEPPSQKRKRKRTTPTESDQVSQNVTPADGEAVEVWSPQQMREFAEHVADHRLAGCFALSLLGLRREEVGGLRWADIDLTGGTLTVEQARVDVNGRDLIEPPKTERSYRTLPLPAHEMGVLRAMRNRHVQERLAVGRKLAPGDLLMSRADGSWLPVRDYSRMFQRERKAAGLPPIILRNIRHSSVSRMREQGVPPEVIAAWHGHSEAMMRDTYTKVRDERLHDVVAALSRAVSEAV
jgi:integrase